jgi:retinol dehydrogenase-12
MASDLGPHQSIKDFAAKATAELERLDVLICNAGIMQINFQLVEGFQSCISVNVVFAFLLAALLLPKMKQTTAHHRDTSLHITIVPSDMHWMKSFPEWNDASIPILVRLNDEKKARMMSRYTLSKLIVILVTREIAAHNAFLGYPVVINAVNPGTCVSDLSRGMPSLLVKPNQFIFHERSEEEGSWNYIYAVSAGKEIHGRHLSECWEGPVSPYVTSEDGRKEGARVWKELSEELEKIQPGILKNFSAVEIVLLRYYRSLGSRLVSLCRDLASRTMSVKPRVKFWDCHTNQDFFLVKKTNLDTFLFPVRNMPYWELVS